MAKQINDSVCGTVVDRGFGSVVMSLSSSQGWASGDSRHQQRAGSVGALADRPYPLPPLGKSHDAIETLRADGSDDSRAVRVLPRGVKR